MRTVCYRLTDDCLSTSTCLLDVAVAVAIAIIILLLLSTSVHPPLPTRPCHAAHHRVFEGVQQRAADGGSISIFLLEVHPKRGAQEILNPFKLPFDCYLIAY